MPIFRPRLTSTLLLPVAALLLALGGCGEQAHVGRTFGDARAGLSAYKYLGCGACHALSNVSVGNASPTQGPKLDGISARRSVSWLRSFLPRHSKAEHLAVPDRRTTEDLVTFLATRR